VTVTHASAPLIRTRSITAAGGQPKVNETTSGDSRSIRSSFSDQSSSL
jgi:hypothetical protein